MTTTMPEWKATAPLPADETVLIEASAGTGKTWQIASLVTRLVAEEGLGIDEILVITFTNAATAELRHRIRKRLGEARDALALPTPPAEDPVLAHLWAPATERERRRARLAAALSDFDRAPISTIHGFAQRTLAQLAFESGQEPDLEVLGEPRPIIDEIVADALALAYAGAGSEERLATLVDMGWDRAGLARLAKEMKDAVAPTPAPAVDPTDPVAADPLAGVDAWRDRVAAFRTWWNAADGGGAGRAAVLAAYDAKPALLTGAGAQRKRYAAAFETIDAWLAEGAPRPARFARKGPMSSAMNALTLDKLASRWKGAPEAFGDFEGRPPFARLDAFLVEQDELWGRVRAGFARRLRDGLERELLRRGLLTYDAMLSRLADRITAPGEGPDGPLATAIRQRYRAALVDEFQDTDGAQWPVLRAVFDRPGWRLLLVGDPKQAIYAFRGADVHVYLDAARTAVRTTMKTNWRSDGPFVAAMNHLWREGSDAFALGGAVDYVEVKAHPKHAEPRLRSRRDERRPFEIRWLEGATIGRDDAGISNKDAGAAAAVRACAREVVRLLGGEVETRPEGADPALEASWTPLRPGDIAVLVRTNRQAELVRDGLAAVGVPAVTGGRGSVFGSPVLPWLASFLDAVAAPGRDGPARILATTPLFGWTARQLAEALAAAGDATAPVADEAADGDSADASDAAGDEADRPPDWAGWIATITGWADRWTTQGFVRVFEGALDAYGVLERLLGAPDGERLATDLRHLTELCHAEERRARLGPGALAAWLRARVPEGDDPAPDEEALRLESDARAVKVVTVHKSKGLEYPVVLLPFLWEAFGVGDSGQPLRFHRTEGGASALHLDVHPKRAAAREAALEAVAAEKRQEKLRQLYVALTRAALHAVAWLGPVGRDNPDGTASALGALATRPLPGAAVAAGDAAGAGDSAAGADEELSPAEAAVERLTTLAARSEGMIGFAREPALGPIEPLRLRGDAVAAPTARRWAPGTKLVSPWQVASYSSMVAGRTYDDDERIRADEALLEEVRLQERAAAEEAAVSAGRFAEPSGRDDVGLVEPAPLAELAGGKEVGTWVHAVFEHLDFVDGRPRDGRDLAALIRDEALRVGVRDEAQHALVADAIPAILATPLSGGATGLPAGHRLADIDLRDRLDELPFDLKLGAGNRYRRDAGDGAVRPEAVRAALAARQGPWPGDAWLADVLGRTRADDGGRDRIFPRIAGILRGFVDVVIRVGRDDGARYYVVDYKTNRIASPTARRDTRRRHYTQPWLAWEMAHGGYHLQALLYTVALHRFLRARLQTTYDYDRHVGGHLYLFLRGMEGADARPYDGLSLGVYHDRWPRAVVVGLDRALGGASADDVRRAIDDERKRGEA